MRHGERGEVGESYLSVRGDGGGGGWYLKTLECYVEEVGEEIGKIQGNISPTVNMLSATHDSPSEPSYKTVKMIKFLNFLCK